MEVTLSSELEKFVAETLDGGTYSSPSELVGEALKRLKMEEDWKTYARDKITRGLEDVAVGRTVSGDEFFAEVAERRKLRA